VFLRLARAPPFRTHPHHVNLIFKGKISQLKCDLRPFSLIFTEENRAFPASVSQFRKTDKAVIVLGILMDDAAERAAARATSAPLAVRIDANQAWAAGC
jgi:hypothetical protein